MENETRQKKRGTTISSTFFKWLLLIVVVGFLSSMVFNWIYQTKMTQNSALTMLNVNVWDVRQDVIDSSNENLLNLTHSIARDINGGASIDQAGLMEILKAYDVAEINVIDENGIIISTTLDEFLHYDMRSGTQSAEFLPLLDGTESEYAQSYQPTSFDPTLSRKYAAVTLSSGGFVQVGYDGERFQRDIDQYAIKAAKNRRLLLHDLAMN